MKGVNRFSIEFFPIRLPEYKFTSNQINLQQRFSGYCSNPTVFSSSSMIGQRPAKVEPMVSSSVGVSRVSVTGISFDEGSGVAHSLQNLESEGLLVWYLGHFIDFYSLFYFIPVFDPVSFDPDLAGFL